MNNFVNKFVLIGRTGNSERNFFPVTSSLLLENKEHKKEHFQLKVLFVSENKEQNGHF